MEDKVLKKKVAHLEFVNDQLGAEIRYVDQLLRLAGFPDGLESIKLAAQEMLSEEEDQELQNDQQ